MGNNSVLVVNNFDPPDEPGVHYRLLCMTGKNKGVSYYLKEKRIILGRGDNVDIQVLDIKSSREHAELVKVRDGYVLTDLKSQNGVMVNDLKIAQHTMNDSDKIIIGQTVFKFNRIEVGAIARLDQDDDDQDYDDDQEEDENDERQAEKKNPLIRILLILLVIGMLLMFMDDEKQEHEEKKPVDLKKMEREEADEFARMMKKRLKEEDLENRKKIEAIIHRGQREFREENYFRAIAEFSLALVLSPKNGRAQFYLNRTKQRLDEKIDQAFIKARREADALKFDAAKVTYCSIIRLLEEHPKDQRYKDAETNLGIIESKTGKEKGEIKCF